MKKFVIAFVTIFYVSTAFGSNSSLVASDSLTFVKIGNVRYDTGKLYLTFNITSFPEQKLIQKEYELPQKDAANFLKLINGLELAGIRSNDSMCIDCRPFSIEYIRAGIEHKIIAYRPGMSADELERWHSYEQQIDSTLSINYWQELFQTELPDGRYAASVGMGTRHYLKEDGHWVDMSQYPLYVLDGGTIISPLKAKRLQQSDNYQIEVLNEPKATAIYGSWGANGAILLRNSR